MSHGHANLSLAVGVAVSLAAHIGVGTWLATASPQTVVVRPLDAAGAFEVPLSLDMASPPPTAPEPKPTVEPLVAAEPVKAPVPPEAARPPEATPVDPVPPPLPTPPPPPPTDDLKLGIAESEAKDAHSFLGEAVPTPHSAPHSEVDQPALSKVDSAVAGQEKPKGSEDGSMTPSEAPMAESSEKAQAQSSPDVPSPAEAPSEAAEKENAAAAAPVADRGVTVAEEDQLIAPAIQAQALPSEEFGQVMRIMPSIGVVWVAMPGAGENELTQKKPLDAAGGEGDKAADKRASEPAAASEPATAAAQSAKPLGTQTPGMENKPQGEKSNKESNPFSVKEMLKFEAGKPLAVKGLEVQTTNPVISDVALITGNPSSPTVEISFNAKGKAARVEFLRRTGRTEWDDSIDHAMHEWTVSGELLKKLQREKPGGVITIRVRILLQ